MQVSRVLERGLTRQFDRSSATSVLTLVVAGHEGMLSANPIVLFLSK